MRRSGSYVIVPVLCVLFMRIPAASGAEASAFSAALYRQHVAYLADDAREGRGVCTPGIDESAQYIADRFAEVGLRPGGQDATWFQEFPITLRRSVSGQTALKVTGLDGALESGRDYVALPFSSAGAFAGPLAFAGYGISAAEFNYDDYAGFDATGRVVLVFRYEPVTEDEKDFAGKSHTNHASLSEKARLAKEKGAVALVFVNPPHGAEEGDEFFSGGGVANRDFGLPVFQVKQTVAERLLQKGGLADLATLQAQLDKERRGASRDLTGLRAGGDAGIVREECKARNVIGILPGQGPLAGEYLVIGAHYDHLGRTTLQFPADGKQAATGDVYIHNGADDNASGTAGLVELARVFAGEPAPARSILFVAFSAEEMGLLGSDYFVNHPTVPVESMVAMLNMDMIGRLKDNKLSVYGVGTAEGFEDMVRRLSTSGGFELSTSASGFGPSDHTSFYRVKVPVLHFFSGLHMDYHKPEDDTEKINAEGGVRIVQLIHDTARAIIERADRPVYVKTAMERRPGRTALKVRIGIMPSYADDAEEGMAISGVVEGGPAERGGMKDGDRILWIGATQVNDIYDYMEALTPFSPGDAVVVKVLREGQVVSLQIVLGASGG